MEKSLATLKKGSLCCGWNYCGQRLAVGYNDGTVSVHDPTDPISSSSSSLSETYKWEVHKSGVNNVVWLPPEYGDAIACVSVDGTISLWEEVQADMEPVAWKLCVFLESHGAVVLDLQFGVVLTSMKMVVAYSDGRVKIYEFLDSLEMKKCQLQAEFSNVLDSTCRFGKASCPIASLAWKPRRGDAPQTSFVLGFSADIPEFNSSKIWEFDEAHQRWLPVAELALPEDKEDKVQAVAWAPNIGRPYEIIAVATCKGIAIWHIALNTDSSGRNFTEKVSLLAGHDGEVWQLDWDMSGMTLASTGSDGMVRLWQSNLNGVWHEQATLDCVSVQH